MQRISMFTLIFALGTISAALPQSAHADDSGAASALDPRPHPVAWLPPIAPQPAGVFSRNGKLGAIERLAAGIGNGPETIEIGPTDGRLYTGYNNGKIMSFAPDGSDPREIADTGGRPNGLHPMRNGDLIVADAVRGLFRVSLDGTMTEFDTTYGGEPMKLIDDLAIAPDEQTIYFTEASHKFTLAHYTWDILEHSGQGRLFSLTVATGEIRLLASGINFANGIIVAPQGDSLLINESGSYRVLRFWLVGPNAGTLTVFVDNLPGYPDNLTFNGRGRIWVALAKPRNRFLDEVGGPVPAVRAAVSRLPESVVDSARESASQTVALDLDGKVVDYLEYRGEDAYAPITTVKEVNGWLYFGSLSAPAIGRLPWPDAAARHL